MPKNLRIVLADDHPSVRYGLRSVLESQAGWEIVGEAADGRAALHIAETLRPDVLILELNMAMLGGLEITRQLSQTLPEIQVLIFTGDRSRCALAR